jgi:N-acetylglutamate synthase-like GNAT family acetyltransferase
MTIVYLADYPQHLSTVAAWVFDYWGHLIPGLTLAQVEERFRSKLQRDALPLALLALEGETPVGTASLQPTDMHTRPDLAPWMASVYVVPAQRGQGIGSRLVQAIEVAARRLGVSTVYLFTPDQQRLYARLGWQEVEETDYRGERVTIMGKKMQDPPELA